MVKKKYKRLGKGKILKFSRKCATVVKEIVELELGPICLPPLEYLLIRSMEDWIEECDIELEAIWKAIHGPTAPVLKKLAPQKKKVAKEKKIPKKSAKKTKRVKK